MPDLTPAARAATEALLSRRWEIVPGYDSTPHRDHHHDGGCPLCRHRMDLGDIDAIATAAVDAAYPLIAAEVLRAEAARTETYVQFRVGGRFGQQQHVHGGISRDALRRRAAEYEQDAKDKDTTATGDER